MVQLFLENWQYLLKQILSIWLPYDIAILLPGIYPTERYAYVHPKGYTRMFTAALFQTAAD